MKGKTLLSVAVLALMFNVSCSRDEESSNSGDKNIELTKNNLKGQNFELLDIKSNIAVDINEDGIKNTDLKKEVSLCKLDDGLSFEKDGGYYIYTFKSLRNDFCENDEKNNGFIQEGVIDLDEEKKTITFYKENTQNVYINSYGAILRQKQNKYILEYKIYEEELGIEVTYTYQTR